MPRTYRFSFYTITLLSLLLAFGGLTNGLNRRDVRAGREADGILSIADSQPGATFNEGFSADVRTRACDEKLAAPDEAARARLAEAYGNLPLSFEANRGQVDERVKFLSRGSGYQLFLTATEAVLALGAPSPQERGERETMTAKSGRLARAGKQRRQAVVRMKIVGANALTEATGAELLPGRVNYLRGDDTARWQTDIPTYASVKYPNIYSGVDLVYYGNQRQLEYDFIVAPGVRPERIKLAFDGVQRIRVDAKGDLLLGTTGGEVRQLRPVIYQEVNGTKQEIDGRYVLKGRREVGFEIAQYDESKPLIIDPVLAYSTFLGGNSGDQADAIAVDASGNAYVTGFAGSTNFPLSNPFQSTNHGIYDVFVTKLNSTGTALVYSTYLGGGNNERAGGIVVDADGNAYITGQTNSADFPVTPGAFDSSYNGAYDAFVTKLNPNGNGLIYSTFLGGTKDENTDSQSFGFYRGGDLVIDADRNAYITGDTASANFPVTPGVVQTTLNDTRASFITKLNPTGSALVFSTYFLPANPFDTVRGTGISIDASRNVFQASHDNYVAWVTKFNPTATSIIFSNRYAGDDGGGFETQDGVRIDTDAAGNVYAAGSTNSFTFPTTPNSFQPLKAGDRDAFVLKLTTNGSLVYSTFIGSPKLDRNGDIDVDDAGNVYLTGETNGSGAGCSSQSFPLVDPLPNTPGVNCSVVDKGVYVTKLDTTGSAIIFSTLLGQGLGQGIAIDTAGNAYAAGVTSNPNFPVTPGAFQTSLMYTSTGIPTSDAFISKISGIAATPHVFNIRGRVTNDAGGGIFQATLTLSGSQTGTTLSDASGYYTFRNLEAGGSYTITPSKTNYAFTPPSRSFTNLSSLQIADFIATPPPQNAIPTVDLTSPPAYQHYTAPANITVSASASDFNGTVTKVDFYANSALIGTDNTAPYSISWNNVGAGDYMLTAVATDNQGATGSAGSTPITVEQSATAGLISGRLARASGVGLSGVTVQLSGPQSATTVTDANGNYSFADLPVGGTYSVTPSNFYYSFSPSSLIFNNLSGSQTGTITATPLARNRIADFDADGRTDISVWQSNSGKWHIINSSNTGEHLQFWGQSSLGDISVPGDYDGDGVTDIAIYRPSEGNWYVLRSSDGASTVQGWGQPGDRPVAADYDGDGKTDVAVYRPSDGNWYINKTSGGTSVRGWGDASDKLVPGDYDGDGLADIAVYRPTDGNWYILPSTGGHLQRNWGLSADRPVPGDYDGDGTTDIAVYRPSEGNWYIIRSSGGAIIRNWGDTTDRPVPGDYDGDGKTDIAVWRPSEGTWYIINSATNSGQQQYLGVSADTPIPSAHLPQ